MRLPALALTVPLAVLFAWICLQDLTAGVGVFTGLTFFEQLGAIGAGSLSAIKGAGVILALAWLLALADRRRNAPFLLADAPWIGWGVVALLFLGIASVLWAEAPGETISLAIRLLQVVVLVFVTYSAIRSARDLRLVAAAFTGGALVAGLYGLVTGSTDEGSERLSGGLSDPNFLAGVLVPALVLGAFAALWPGQRTLVRLALVPALAAGLYTVFETESRGGLVALAVALVVSLAVAGPLRARFVALTLVAGALALGYFAVAASTESRERVTDLSAEGSSGRADQWAIAADVTRDHPVLGVGLGNFPVVEPRYTAQTRNLFEVEQVLELQPVVHNTFLELGTELGLGGFVLGAIVLLGPILVAARALRRAAGKVEPAVEQVLRALLPASLALLAAYFFLSGLYEKQLWLMLGLLLGAVTVVEAQLRERGQGPDPGAAA